MFNISALTKTLLHEETLIGTTLSHFHALEEAQKLGKIALKENPIVSFGRKLGGSIAYGHEIAPATLEHARIRVSPKDVAPEYRYFKRIASCNGTKVQGGAGHGLSASAWIETDVQGMARRLANGTCDLRLCYPGYTGKMYELASADTQSMWSSLRAEFPQAREVGQFLDKTMNAAKEMELSVGKVINTSWSMGAPNALTSKLYFNLRNIPTTAILGDAWKASAAVQNIPMRSEILRPLFNGGHAEMVRYTQPQLRKMLTEDVISIYPAIKNQAGGWTRMSLTAPAMRGELPILERLGLLPFGDTVGQVFHLDARNMKVIERLPGLGDTHHRTNIINHLATYGDGILHEITQVAAAKGAGHSVV